VSTVPITPTDRKTLVALIAKIEENFKSGDWLALGTRTGALDDIRNHPRLLRSLNFGDEDYSGNVHEVIIGMVEQNPENLALIQDYVVMKYGDVGVNVSTAPSRSRVIFFSPTVFDVPDTGTEHDLVAVMIPFAAEFEPVFNAIMIASATIGLRCQRAKDIWVQSAVIQDVFGLIFRSQIVICDFTGKNPNVFYEAGIAHTLGKHVIPITQHGSDIPFDLHHHRFLSYLNNKEGLAGLGSGLVKRMMFLR
jgi:hypothetical protein